MSHQDTISFSSFVFGALVLYWCCLTGGALTDKTNSGKILDLPLGSSCVTGGKNGTCTRVFDCPTSALTYLYKKAGFEIGDRIPELPDTCSFDDDLPVVCCTDCLIGPSGFDKQVVAPLGILRNKNPSVAWNKCYEYFRLYPYPCRGRGNIKVQKTWNETRECHEFGHYVALAVGGRDAQRWEFPHMALLGFGDDVQSAQWLCGGSVISERYILTAAHCTSTKALGSIKFAALGLLKRTDPKENWKIYNIKRIIKHPDYKSPAKYHDIALLETETEIIFGKDLLPACLHIGEKEVKSAEASGWGRLGHRQALADNLQVVNLGAYNDTECASVFPPHRLMKRGYDHATQMCFGSNYYIVDTCEGDSGGPLQTNQYKCLYEVAGVTSFGKNCGTLGAPGMYTRVAHYVPWIESIVWPELINHTTGLV